MFLVLNTWLATVNWFKRDFSCFYEGLRIAVLVSGDGVSLLVFSFFFFQVLV